MHEDFSSSKKSQVASEDNEGTESDLLKPLLKIAQVARFLQYSTSQVYKLVERGEIPHYKLVSGGVRFDHSELIVWLQKQSFG